MIDIRTKILIKRKPEQRDIYDLFKECRMEGVVIRGDRAQMEAVLKKKRCPVRYKHRPEDLVSRCYITYFLWKVGNGHKLQQSYNSHDFYSSAPISRIPKVYVYCTMNYAFDIRSLLAYRQSRDVLYNPYTGQPIDDTQIQYKLKWLQRFGCISSIADPSCAVASQPVDYDQYIINVFSHITRYQYVDYQWFTDLTLVQLQRLYQALHEIWYGRLPMSTVYRCDISTSKLFNNLKNIHRYNETMYGRLRVELLRDIEMLVTDGRTEQHRKSGCYIFMLGLVLVSSPASRCHPNIFEAAHY